MVVLQKVKVALHKRGSRTIAGLGRAFRAFDSFDGNKKIDAREFKTGLKDIGVDLTQKESDVLLAFFDKNGDGCVDISEFLIGIRGELNDVRRKVTLQAFEKFDRDKSGIITIEDLQDVYSVEMHPKFQNGELTKEEIFGEFLASFGDKNNDGVITVNLSKA